MKTVPPAPVFYVDEDLDSDDFVDPLLQAGFVIERHRDNFPAGTADGEWILEVAQRGWYAFSHDVNILRSKTQSDIVLDCGLGLFIVRGHKMPHGRVGRNVASAKLAIDRFVKKNFCPFIASIRNPSKKTGKGSVAPLRLVDREWNKGKMKAQKQRRQRTS